MLLSIEVLLFLVSQLLLVIAYGVVVHDVLAESGVGDGVGLNVFLPNVIVFPLMLLGR